MWFALGAGTLLCLLLVAGVYAPLLGLIGSSAGAAWFVPVPIGAITLVTLLGFAVSLALLALITLVRSVPLAWTLALSAVIVGLLTSIFPAFAVAQAGVERGGQLIPWILEWINTAIAVLP
ncbi:hypothetical protein CTB96_01795 [Cryobacterium arcticum]|uniref:Uncharacterized protein n=1 Tax=Cryobacterium arcticum TaxID=670052 RepID=A0A318A2T5_9MICO|nr:hypothetical protein CTB96_01795 [Cryobacterium arcticum]